MNSIASKPYKKRPSNLKNNATLNLNRISLPKKHLRTKRSVGKNISKVGRILPMLIQNNKMLYLLNKSWVLMSKRLHGMNDLAILKVSRISTLVLPHKSKPQKLKLQDMMHKFLLLEVPRIKTQPFAG